MKQTKGIELHVVVVARSRSSPGNPLRKSILPLDGSASRHDSTAAKLNSLVTGRDGGATAGRQAEWSALAVEYMRFEPEYIRMRTATEIRAGS